MDDYCLECGHAVRLHTSTGQECTWRTINLIQPAGLPPAPATAGPTEVPRMVTVCACPGLRL